MRHAAPWVVAALGLALVVAGVVVFAAANRGPSDVGWAAYAPLEPADSAYQSALTFRFDGATVLWTGGHLVGAGLVVLGLLVLAGALGWLLGLRTGRRGSARA